MLVYIRRSLSYFTTFPSFKVRVWKNHRCPHLFGVARDVHFQKKRRRPDREQRMTRRRFSSINSSCVNELARSDKLRISRNSETEVQPRSLAVRSAFSECVLVTRHQAHNIRTTALALALTKVRHSTLINCALPRAYATLSRGFILGGHAVMIM